MSTNRVDGVEPNEQEPVQDMREITEEEALAGITGGVRPVRTKSVSEAANSNTPKIMPTTVFKRPGKPGSMPGSGSVSSGYASKPVERRFEVPDLNWPRTPAQ